MQLRRDFDLVSLVFAGLLISRNLLFLT